METLSPQRAELISATSTTLLSSLLLVRISSFSLLWIPPFTHHLSLSMRRRHSNHTLTRGQIPPIIRLPVRISRLLNGTIARVSPRITWALVDAPVAFVQVPQVHPLIATRHGAPTNVPNSVFDAVEAYVAQLVAALAVLVALVDAGVRGVGAVGRVELVLIFAFG
jgi:hypothetical protein